MADSHSHCPIADTVPHQYTGTYGHQHTTDALGDTYPHCTAAHRDAYSHRAATDLYRDGHHTAPDYQCNGQRFSGLVHPLSAVLYFQRGHCGIGAGHREIPLGAQ